MTAEPEGPAHLVEAIVEDDRWERHDIAGLAERAARAALGAFDLDPEAFEIGLLACGDARIADLNATFRGKARPTNVLSWPSGAEPSEEGAQGGEAVFLGDIAIAFETCRKEAEDAGIPLETHATHLVVHAVVHLLGYDHETDSDAEEMEAIEAKILASLGLENPYT